MFASFRAVAGRIATSAKFAKLMILTHILNAFTALAALHVRCCDTVYALSVWYDHQCAVMIAGVSI